MKDLEVGMYVRSNGYINKIVKIKDDEVAGKILLLDKYPYTYIEYEFDELKASHNIIDLIEIGDYVNGIRVINVIFEPFKYVKCLNSHIFKEEEIESIVTKEQFENMAYKVEE